MVQMVLLMVLHEIIRNYGIYYISLLQVVKLTNCSKLKETQIRHFSQKSMSKIFRGRPNSNYHYCNYVGNSPRR